MARFAEAIAAHATARPTHPAIRFENEVIDYAGLESRISAEAGRLRAEGVEVGDRVVVLAGNDPSFIVVLLACVRIGAIFVPLNTRLTAAEIAFQVGHCSPVRAIAADDLLDELAMAAPQLAVDPLTMVGTVDDVAVSTTGFAADAPAMIVYTSGTTGRPKGATHTHGSVDATVDNGVVAHDLGPDDVGLEFLPLFHVGGLNIQTLPLLTVGGTVVLHRGFDADAVFDALEADELTISIIVPTPMQVMIDHPRWAHVEPGRLRGFMTGSSIVPAPLLQAFNDAGLRAGQVYGATETGPTSVVLRFEDAARVGSCGRASGTAEVRLVGSAGREASHGEVQIRGPHVFCGYWNDPEATARAFDGDWYRTGDVAETDADGWVTIRDRLGDMIISGGENVYPAEIEPVLADAPGVAELTVIGLADERWGQTPVAVVVAEPGCEPTLEQLREHGGRALARYKLPTRLELVDELPRTALGKVRKNELAARFP